MDNGSDWVEDVKRWYFTEGRSTNVFVGDEDESVAIGYEAANPALQACHWPDAPVTRDR